MQITIYDIATYGIVSLFICLMFMKWYLRKYGNDKVQDILDHTMWLELAFVYRDFTKTHFGKAHYIYHCIIVVISTIIILFTIGVYDQLKNTEYPMNIFIFAASATAIAIIFGLIYKTSKKEYYKE